MSEAPRGITSDFCIFETSRFVDVDFPMQLSLSSPCNPYNYVVNVSITPSAPSLLAVKLLTPYNELIGGVQTRPGRSDGKITSQLLYALTVTEQQSCSPIGDQILLPALHGVGESYFPVEFNLNRRGTYFRGHVTIP